MLAIGTRFWDKGKSPSTEKIKKFIDKALKISDMVIVAINTQEDKSNALDLLTKDKIDNLIILPVNPWGFTFAMNALIYTAGLKSHKYLLSQSVEIEPNKDSLEQMLGEMNDDTLCVGARLEGHDFRKGQVVANGRTIPWNTCRFLNLPYYQIYGFPLIGDTAFDPSLSGVEELCADSLAQKMLSSENKKLQIKLMEVEGIKWSNSFENEPERKKAHDNKMMLKYQRPQIQLDLTKLPPATVIHL